MISVIVPTYNERDNIRILIERLERSLAGAPHEVVVVDDNSPDGTAPEVERLAKRLHSLRLVKRERKRGLTGAIAAGAAAAEGDVVVVMDADLSHPPEKVPLLASALKGCDIAIGSRLTKGGAVASWPFHRKLVSRGADFLARLLLGVRVSDPLSGFFAVRKTVFRKTRFRAKGYKLLLNILADNPHLRVREIPYVFTDRHTGKTKLGMGEIGNYLLDLLRIRFG